MNQDFQRPLLVDVGSPTTVPTSLSHPTLPLPTPHHHHTILIHDGPQIYDSSSSDDEDDDDDDDDDDVAGRECGGYTMPFLYLDMIWNTAFVLVSVFVLLTTVQERPSTPLRVWIFGYALQCLVHVGFVWAESQSQRRWSLGGGGFGFGFRGGFCSFSCLCHNSVIQKLESINSLISSIWWVFGFYWIVIGGQPLLQDSPRLYWLSVVFLAFDVFFMIFCIAVASIIFFLLFCCFPILATVAYAMTAGEGASENDIESLPKYVYRQQISTISSQNYNKQEGNLSAPSGNSAAELCLHPDDSECCICLYKYVDGTELCRLPCNHHFHHKCITKWLRINATCPLCKFNILRGEMLV